MAGWCCKSILDRVPGVQSKINMQDWTQTQHQEGSNFMFQQVHVSFSFAHHQLSFYFFKLWHGQNYWWLWSPKHLMLKHVNSLLHYQFVIMVGVFQKSAHPQKDIQFIRSIIRKDISWYPNVIPVLKPLATHPWQRLGSLSRVALAFWWGRPQKQGTWIQVDMAYQWFADFRIWIDSIV